ncbi:14443_t:CDS:1, partial [Racocetra persica]
DDFYMIGCLNAFSSTSINEFNEESDWPVLSDRPFRFSVESIEKGA